MKTDIDRSLKELYNEDFVFWIDETVKQLKDRALVDLDWEHLIEEIESLGNEQRRKVRSYLKQLFIHLLLYRYWLAEKERCAKGWRDEIENFRDELEDLFDSKILYKYYQQELDNIYQKARLRAIQKTGLPSSTFPKECPFTSEQILDFEFLPED
ncbi:DUF29 domain-containing protein [Crocosphaera sp. XPORK-15E]|uniref:DUF29 domain-containing protein n=1 Tax=Crocosphaera sp. XPORK-15E TaxID=3110247 RepID=UPI002B219C1F|nr:DUF29 domain-containing protein [Crocosphaera sp. XPORK-15E]MEA5533536.1 DUF29 domain-containing protein [Crocosphaera sp. XPORK-15E]